MNRSLHPRWRRALRGFVTAESGSAPVANIVSIIAVGSLVLFAVLHVTGVLQVPGLIFLVLSVVVLVALWDAWRERRRAADLQARGKETGVRLSFGERGIRSQQADAAPAADPSARKDGE